MTPPTSGRILGRGRLASLVDPAAGLHPDLSGRRNLYLLAATSAIPRALVTERLDEIAAFAELGDFLDVPVSQYSSGMALRLAFAAVVHLDPDILIADEVLAAGDLAFQERCLCRLLQMRDEGGALLFVSHDMNAMRRICDRVLWLDEGKLVEIGPTEEGVGRYENSAMALANRRLRRLAKRSRGAEWGHIDGVRLLDQEGEPIEAMSCATPATLEISFSALVPDLEAQCTVDVYAKGVLAFRSQQPETARIERRGVYRGLVVLPPRLLAETVYTVSATVALRHDGEERLFVAANALTFPVRELADPPLPVTTRRDLGGVVRPELRWRLRRRKDGRSG